MPSMYNDDLLLERSEVDMFFTEEFFHVMFSKSYVNTPNAANADLFYVPVYYHRFMRHLYHKGVDVKQKLEAEVSLMRAVVLKLQNYSERKNGATLLSAMRRKVKCSETRREELTCTASRSTTRRNAGH